MEILFATNNLHKVDEIRAVAPLDVRFLTLSEVGINEDLPESGDSLKENAEEKATYIYRKYGFSCMAEDTGLEVDALDGAPGVHTARYAGEGASREENIKKLQAEMKGKKDRNARFHTVIALCGVGRCRFFEGVCEGYIAEKPAGAGGFGYDPIFIPKGYDKTFAELEPEIKQKISHRARALDKFLAFLQEGGE